MKRYPKRRICCRGRWEHSSRCPRSVRLHFVHQRPSSMPVRLLMRSR